MDQNIVKLKDVSLKINDEFLLYENFNLTINKGKMVAVVGQSGSGKTTVFKILTKYFLPTKGLVELFGSDIGKITKKEWKNIIKKVGFLSQKPNLIDSQNVFHNITKSFNNYKNWFYKLFNILTKQQKIKIFEVLDELKILNKSFVRVDELSGGQQQRVEIAKLLLKDVELILADEPTSNLDFKNSNDVLDLLRKLNQEKNISVIVNIHDLNLALEKFDEIIAIKNGKILVHEDTKKLDLWKLKKLLD
ncbi:phosphonate ABC transporter ATP-binding protein [Mycoplasma crocodyli]|uniref:Phosphate/phosphonate ABC transporter, ATP-binding protein PhnC n=1 Tax=Mycoplasma crocodyli (strain ATCC 51981 / MP145) TaxID=512564 RepID=D5E5R7_MYCCM|nr:ATP-binding cassette domain-containing protein [Mycoplasma crocodyli]ADE19482.1 phosphate/phosphonate ABC transporter, ATP-binding protein PhnC [Mycoplasma crocodyli MP145]